MDAVQNLDNLVANVSTVFLTDADVSRLATWPKVIAALADAYSRPFLPAMVPPRIMARGEGFWLRSLPTFAEITVKPFAASADSSLCFAATSISSPNRSSPSTAANSKP